MKRKFVFFTILFLLLTFILVSCSTEGNLSSKEVIKSSDYNTTSEQENKPNDVKKGSKTLFIYMCGSDLESKQGAATKNIEEILSTQLDDNINVVIQTGGAKNWRKYDISPTKSERYIVKNKKLELISSNQNMNMGSSKTLSDFLTWGEHNYLSETNMLILWDHGGGSVKGVCFDENYQNDSLSLLELREAFESANLRKNFEIIGFDACLMASLETAWCIKDYADYMVASEEISPTEGWDYITLLNSFSTKDDSAEVGKDICDSFMERCEKNGKGDISTLSLFDLSGLDSFMDDFNLFAEELIEFVSNNNFSRVIAGAKRGEKFGLDSVFSGSTNMIDFQNFAQIIYLHDINEFMKIYDIVEKVVIYCSTNYNRDNGGISFYYPIEYKEKEIANYISLGISNEYNRFLSTYFQNVPKQTISFSNKGYVTEDGAFGITLAPESKKYLATMTYYLIEKDSRGVSHILFSDCDINSDWNNLKFTSNFKGTRWLYQGHPFYYEPFKIAEKEIEYIAPLIISGKQGNMRIYYETDEENNKQFYVPRSSASERKNLLPNEPTNPGEGEVVCLSNGYKMTNNDMVIEFGDEFVIPERPYEEMYSEISIVPLPNTEYYYVFVATDIFGNKYYSDLATLTTNYTYEELLNNPLQDGSYAATVTDITSFS